MALSPCAVAARAGKAQIDLRAAAVCVVFAAVGLGLLLIDHVLDRREHGVDLRVG